MAKAPAAYKVKLTIGDASVEIEGHESGVVKIVEALSQNLGSQRRSLPAPVSGSPLLIQPSGVYPPSVSQTPPARTPDVRSFFDEKRPSSDVEAAATAAYYHRYLAPDDQRRETIDSALLQDAFRLARRPLPPNLRYTLQNARNAGYLDSAGSGEFKLNAVGYNLVEHALGSNDVQGASSKRRGTKKKKRPGTSRGGSQKKAVSRG